MAKRVDRKEFHPSIVPISCRRDNAMKTFGLSRLDWLCAIAVGLILIFVEVVGPPWLPPFAILWFLVMFVFAVIRFTVAMFERKRIRREAAGLCGECGYDLRGANHAVCPECGAAVGGTGHLQSRS